MEGAGRARYAPSARGASLLGIMESICDWELAAKGGHRLPRDVAAPASDGASA